jgi:aspartate-semialdehyde dehydrogenase
MAPRSANGFRVAIAGASSLRGKELVQVLEVRNFPASDVVLLDDAAAAGTLTEAGGEATFIRALDEECFKGARFVFFAGPAGDAARDCPAALRSGATVIDLSAPPSEIPGALPWIPSLARILPPPPAKKREARGAQVFRAPSTGVIIGCTLAAALAAFSPLRLAIVLLAPVSEHGQEAVDELESQSAHLLSLRPVAQGMFDAQMAFNLLIQYGKGSRLDLQKLRTAVARETEEYLAGRVPLPAMELVQVPAFHGYCFSAYAEFRGPHKSEELAKALRAAGVRVSSPEDSVPNNVSVAGESEIHVAAIEDGANVSGGLWLWGATDSLRLTATNAARVAEELIAS